ncbi:MAG: hypothetical protein RBR68_13495 [Tenuifilaceae bacterium]|nr:hypothetical protein [Tenuifilaceae bacterium]
MEDITLSAFQIISSYGGIGAALAYFMVKDFTQGKDNNATNMKIAVTMEKLVIAINTMTNCKGINHSE